jgi:hypothetical protein
LEEIDQGLPIERDEPERRNENRKHQMKIKVALNTKGRELSDSLDKVNGKARSATASAMDILNATEIAEKQLAAFGIAKSSRIGAEMTYTSGGSVAKAYKYTRIANRIKAVRGGSFWYVTSIERVELFPNQDGGIKVGLNADQEKTALAGVRAKFYNI